MSDLIISDLVAIVVLTTLIVMLHKKIEHKIERLRELSYGNPCFGCLFSFYCSSGLL